jgi:hypothetical protein
MRGDTMPSRWPAETDFALWELDVLDRTCPVCGRMMYICDHRYRHLHTLQGPVELVCKLNHCPDPGCPGHTKTKSPELELEFCKIIPYATEPSPGPRISLAR